jgi:hypothetical protein
MRSILVLLLSVACATSKPAATPASGTIRRSILLQGVRVGTSVVATAADGTITNTLDIHDNGRGPHADATLRLAQDGTLASLDATGHTELNAPVDEHFSIRDGRARWHSKEEQGEKDLAGPSFFVPNSATDADAFLVAALFRNGGTLRLLPGGTARIERVGEVSAGASRFLLHAISGLSFQPRYVWTREDQSFFAEVYPGFWFGEEGQEGVAPTLVAKQDEVRKGREQVLAGRLGRKPPPAGVALAHARVLDVERGAWVPDQTVVVQDGVVKSVSGDAPPASAEVIDLQGKALLPGLWDMHVHLSPDDGLLDIASGVTTVRDVGNRSEILDDMKKAFDEGRAIGPHVLRAGFIEGRGKDAASAEVTATDADEARKAVEFFQTRGYEMIKIYNSVDPGLVPVLTREAHARGMGVTGHIPHGMLANEAVRAGYDGVEHINQLMLNFFADHQTETRTPLRFSLVGDKAGDFDLHGPEAKQFYALLREHHTVVDPTYVTFEPVYLAEQGKVLPGWSKTVPRLPVQAQRSFLTGGLPLEGKKDLYARSWEKMLGLVKVLHDEQVTVVAGTDYLAGFSLHRELELLVQGGLTPAEALQAATIVPAQVMKAAGRSGSIAAGKDADLVVIDGDPLVDISDVRKTVLTLRGGVLYTAKDLCEASGVTP